MTRRATGRISPARPNRTAGAPPAPTREAAAPVVAPWGYEPHNGPSRWGTLDPAFSACDLGKEQSPIDLIGGRRVGLTPIEFDYRRTRVAIENTGHTIQVNPEPGSGIVLDRVRYDLRQFHFHHGSEHTASGCRWRCTWCTGVTAADRAGAG